MMRIDFNENWTYHIVGHETERQQIRLPHDAMLRENRTIHSAGGVNSAWFESNDYVYEKKFTLPEDCAQKKVIFEFEGVYRNAEVYINDAKVAFRPYGFTNFYVDATQYVFFGAENRIRVLAKNSDLPNCRWYSGAGIYRPVTLYVLDSSHILLDGIKIESSDYRTKKVTVKVLSDTAGLLKIEIFNGQTLLAAAEKQTDGQAEFLFELKNAPLWNDLHPNLLTCRVVFGDDVRDVKFGIRSISVSAQKGLLINGERVVLKGACLHSDNGILGAAAYDFAEKRKARILKQNGYNAVRCAHNPASKAFLDACDELGLYVMDEYTDGWFMHKTKHDYASDIMQWWRADLTDMVNKDYNHPSVIMYSIGNEVGESAKKEGVEFCEKLVDFLHSLDNRPVTCGINIFFNFLSSMGMGVYSDKKADQNKNVGSAFFNNLAGLFGANFMKFGATLHGSDVKTRKVFQTLDVSGYNYGIFRYKKDVKKYPDRIIVGSETFCGDAVKFWDFAKNNPAVIGDFVWAGMDYLGEVGIGSWEYKHYAKTFQHLPGWISAGSGRIDLTGKPLSEMRYTRVAFELDKLGIGVVPVDSTRKKHSPSAWKMSNALETWSFNGCDGMPAKVEVYTRAHKVRLLINGKHVATKKVGKNARVDINTRYHTGTLTAIAYDRSGTIIEKVELRSASDQTKLTLCPEDTSVRLCDGLCYVRLQLTDEKGCIKPLERARIRVSVENGEILALGHACPYNEDGYLTDSTDTYYGEALAIIRPLSKGAVVVKASCDKGVTSCVILATEQ